MSLLFLSLHSSRTALVDSFFIIKLMGSCISSQYSYPALDPSKLIPNLSFYSIKKMKKKRNAAANAAELNADSSDRRPAVSSECVEEEELQQVHGRMTVNGASEVACLYTQQGKKGTNQDAMLVWENFASRKDTIFCGVFDGHGPYGHLVSMKVRDSLPLKLCSQWKNNISYHSRNGSIDSQDTTVSSILDTEEVDSVIEKPPEMYHILQQSFLKAFKLMDKELKLSPTINCFCSGSTAVTVIKQGNDLVIGNVGDSRAILGTRDNDNSLVAEQLTVDLKPNLPREAERIQQCNGRVFALQDEPEVARVWLPNNDSPGLAMARAFGDFCLKDYGLISVPDISYRCIGDKDEFIVLASDGIWDALSNKEVVDIVASAPTRGTAARALVDCAVRSWRLKYPTSKIDDCAAICLFLEPTQIDSYELPKVDGNTEVDELDTSQTQISSIKSDTNIDEMVTISEEQKEEKLAERTKSVRSLAECISNSEEEEWSALEGITRVNSLLILPRFLSGDKMSTRRKWCS